MGTEQIASIGGIRKKNNWVRRVQGEWRIQMALESEFVLKIFRKVLELRGKECAV